MIKVNDIEKYAEEKFKGPDARLFALFSGKDGILHDMAITTSKALSKKTGVITDNHGAIEFVQSYSSVEELMLAVDLLDNDLLNKVVHFFKIDDLVFRSIAHSYSADVDYIAELTRLPIGHPKRETLGAIFFLSGLSHVLRFGWDRSGETNDRRRI